MAEGGLRGRHTGPGADGEALGAARGWLPGAVDGPRSQALVRRCLGGRPTLREGVLGLWVRPPNRASATSVHTVPLAKPATRLGFRLPSPQVVEAHHTVRPQAPSPQPSSSKLCAGRGQCARR